MAGQWLLEDASTGVDSPDLDGVDGVNMLDFALLTHSWAERGHPIVINELMASNSAFDKDPQGDYDDWIELYNAGDEPFDVGGMHLTDDLGEAMKWQIPDVNSLLTTIPAHGFLRIWADEDITATPGLHADFELDSSGDKIGLFDANGTVLIDSVLYPVQSSDISYGRYPDGEQDWRFMALASPNAPNLEAYLGRVEDVEFSHERGFYDESFYLTIATETDDTNVYFTTDGLEPYNSGGLGETAVLYCGPILIDSTMCVRATGLKGGFMPSPTETNTYIFGADLAIRSLPVISLVGDEQAAFYEPNGVMAIVGGQYEDGVWTPDGPECYNNPMSSGMAFERPVSFEFFNTGSEPDLQVDCGIRVHGSDWVRQRYRRCEGYWEGYCKFSFRLYFRGLYGENRLNYGLFPYGLDEFESIVIRGGHQDRVNPFIRDELVRRLHLDMGHAASTGTNGNVFINGEYKGYYNPCEHIKDDFCRDYYDSKEDWDVITNTGVRDGDRVSWSELFNCAKTCDLSDPLRYMDYASRLDIPAFADYLILQLWSGNSDWPMNNWVAASEHSPDGIWRFFVWDAEGGMWPWLLTTVYFDRLNTKVFDSAWAISWFYSAVKVNEDFKQIFTDRICKHFFNGGALTEANITRRFFELRDQMSVQIPVMDPYIPDVWVPNRLGIFLDACRAEGVFTCIGPQFRINDIPPQERHVSCGDILTIVDSNVAREIYYTMDGSDPRVDIFTSHETGLPAGGLSDTAIRYTGGLALTESSRILARTLDNGVWSGLTEAVFSVGAVADSLRITEIMYNPLNTGDPNDPNEEYVELTNIGHDAINLNLVRFTSGIDFTFGDLELGPGDYVVVVRDEDAFLSAYPSFSGIIGGEYLGRLDNDGERIVLQDAAGAVICDFKYSDGWRSISDGGGYSLTIVRPDNPDPNTWALKDGWRASAMLAGSPGFDDGGIIPDPGSIVINEVLAHSHDEAPDWIELHNTTDAAIEVGGWYLSDDRLELMKYRLKDGTIIDAGEYLVLFEDVNFGGGSTDTGSITGFALSEDGEEVCLASADSNGLTGYRVVESFGASYTGVSFGRYFKRSTGTYNFVAMDHGTPGQANSYPLVGPVVIGEILYHPDWPEGGSYVNDRYEYIRLDNITGSAVSLWREDKNLGWRFTEGIDFSFPHWPDEVTLAAGEHLYVVRDPNAFMWRYPHVPVNKVFGPYSGKLDNDGERIELCMPGDIDKYGRQQYIRIERVTYSDGSHPGSEPGEADLWPVEADGIGKALIRIASELYGNDPNNWVAGEPSPL